MNKKQMVVMWVWVVLIFLVWAGAPRGGEGYMPKGSNGGVMAYQLVQPADLFANWILFSVVASATGYTLRTKKPDGEKGV